MPFRDLLNLLRPTTVVSLDDRRGAVRLRCKLDVSVQAGELSLNATVVDVTLNNLSLQTDRALPLEQTVRLARDDFGRPWEGEVIWCRPEETGTGFRVGVRYPDDQQVMLASWLEPALKQTGFEVNQPGGRRRLLRVSGRVPCRVQSLSGELTTQGDMLDLSQGGAKVESSVPLPPQETLEFETEPLGGLPALRGKARVTLCKPAPDRGKWRSGLRFVETDDQDVLKYMDSMMRSKWTER